MTNLYKFYMIMICMVCMMTGCAKTQETLNEDVSVSEAADSEKEAENTVEETEWHPVQAAGIDYLEVEGITLESGTEIALIATNSQNNFYSIVENGAVQAVADLNTALGYTGKDKLTLTFAGPKTEDVIDQINIIDQFLDKAPDALCIAFTDASACKTQMQLAKNNGIKLIAFDTPDDNRAAEALIATDNIAAATVTAQQMFDAVDDGGKIAVIVHNSLKQTGQDRYQAIVDELSGNYANKHLQLVDVVYMEQDERTEEEIFDELLENYPDLAGIICTDLMTTEMAIDYAMTMSERNFLISGFDISEKIANGISEGIILGTVAQDPYRMGYAAVVAAARSIADMKNAEDIYTDHVWVDASNLNSEEVQSLHYK